MRSGAEFLTSNSRPAAGSRVGAGPQRRCDKLSVNARRARWSRVLCGTQRTCRGRVGEVQGSPWWCRWRNKSNVRGSTRGF